VEEAPAVGLTVSVEVAVEVERRVAAGSPAPSAPEAPSPKEAPSRAGHRLEEGDAIREKVVVDPILLAQVDPILVGPVDPTLVGRVAAALLVGPVDPSPVVDSPATGFLDCPVRSMARPKSGAGAGETTMRTIRVASRAGWRADECRTPLCALAGR
jgi:hypothetical protein